jgi:superfamily II DNA helicase RecQ
MLCRVITLKYDTQLEGFPEEPLRAAQACGELLEVREHFFERGGVPHLALTLLLDESGKAAERALRPAGEADPGEALPEAVRHLYRALRQWRNERAKAEGVPAYALFRNAQLAEVCRRLPRSLAALREIEGIGEATCRKYGEALLAMIPADLATEGGAT